MKSFFSAKNNQTSTGTSFPFDDLTFDQRVTEFNRLKKYHPDKIPILIRKYNESTTSIDKYKYISGEDITMGIFIGTIRKRINLPAEKALFFLVNNTLLSPSQTIGEIYNKKKSDDGFLRMTYSEENTFGDI